MGVLDIFKSKPKIYATQIHDRFVLHEIFSLMKKIEDVLYGLKEALSTTDVILKDAKLATLESDMLLVRSKVEGLKADINRIIQIEIDMKNYITIQDDYYLEDKALRLESISEALDELIQVVSVRPSFSELKRDLISHIFNRMNGIIENFNAVARDDYYLEKTYSKLPKM